MTKCQLVILSLSSSLLLSCAVDVTDTEVTDTEVDDRSEPNSTVEFSPAAPIQKPEGCMLDFNADGRFSGTEQAWAGSYQLSPGDCHAQGGVVMGGVPFPSSRFSRAATQTQGPPTSFPLPTAATPEIILKYIKDARITRHHEPFVPESQDCDDYAEDAEKAIERLVPGAGTFTITFCGEVDEEGDFIDSKEQPVSAHAITDVHLDGVVTWLEPQWAEDMVLDMDGDGQVSVVFGDAELKPTESDGENGCLIIVYESRAAAEADLGPLDEEPDADAGDSDSDK
jgi:hypothetical protein